MRKSKALEFDEASSDSDSDRDNSDEEPGSDDVGDARKMAMMPTSDSSAVDESDEDGDEDDDDDDDDSDSSHKVEARDDDGEKPSNGDNMNEDSDGDKSDEEDLPLHERIRNKEQRGLAMQEIRERKSKALKMAGKRLADLKRKKSSTNNQNTPTEKEVPKKKTKKSKHAPTEVSSKRADYFRRGVPKLNESGVGVEIGANRYKAVDPRTSNLHGHLSEEQFEKNYEFLEEIRNKEISALKKQIAARKVTGKKGTKIRKRLNMGGGSLAEDQEKLTSLKQQKAEFERRKIQRSAKQTVKRKIRDDVAEGKRGVYFLKRKEKRRLEMEAKLDELRKRGGEKAVDKAIERRRQKNKSRDASRFVK
mmetsp:Transcript_40334/g.62008  ORF Transcript_40334/g.62008 Transcript_40334/m.62008 type:complete len:363 (-) Transcript_40334:33-1121(-)|eukprot:CAMPEP_0117025454 /NCGR_PEP_ID=MMETSP0472-20121206/18797_1 /TAXON_ID=693140 ORGANISM="Tiarina fusus, Strain LIS" /NCGR_SAMPLE_ID=MMETSP0472 /ASSEMBLY_ACC=CAM_ASM_000603 /LENGTH=362 /DNA_ID=CAMNT_0004732165 /DNA_START=105 /DNA_END=1193 /DNA_ORIENTATION=-